MAGAAAGAGMAAAAFKIGESFDGAFDAIRIGTGATGDSLQALQGDFKAVFKGVPDDIGAVSQVLADLNTRTGQTGEGLQNLTTSVLDLARLTGGDAVSSVADVTRVFGDWSVATEDQTATLDKLFRASQSTGASVASLAQKAVQFGGPMRQLGFDFDTTIGLLGKFEKEGVNTELVFGSMRIALGKMAKDGIPAREGLLQTMEAIKNTGDASAANALALELFGARAGPDMAAAIREGRFELGDLLDTISNGSETIAGATGDTQDFAEAWEKFSHRVLVAVEPVGTAVFNLAGLLFDRMEPAFDSLTESVAPFASALGNIIGLLTEGDPEARIGMFNELVPIFGGDLAEKIALVTSGLIGFVGALSGDPEGIGRMANAIDGLFGGGTADKIFGIVDAIGGFVGAMNTMLDETAAVFGMTVNWGEVLQFVAIAIGVSLVAAIGTAIVAIGAIKLAFIGLMGTLEGLQAAWIIATKSWSNQAEILQTSITNQFNIIKGAFTGLLDMFTTVDFGALVALWSNAFSRGLDDMIAGAREKLGILSNLLPHSPAKEGPLSVPVNWGWLFADMPRVAAEAVVQTYGVLNALGAGMRSSGIGDPTRDFTNLVKGSLGPSAASGIGDPTRDFTGLVAGQSSGGGFFDSIRDNLGYNDPSRNFTDYVKGNTGGQNFQLGDIHVNVQAGPDGKVSVEQFTQGVSDVANQVAEAMSRALSGNPGRAVA